MLIGQENLHKKKFAVRVAKNQISFFRKSLPEHYRPIDQLYLYISFAAKIGKGKCLLRKKAYLINMLDVK